MDSNRGGGGGCCQCPIEFAHDDTVKTEGCRQLQIRSTFKGTERMNLGSRRSGNRGGVKESGLVPLQVVEEHLCTALISM